MMEEKPASLVKDKLLTLLSVLLALALLTGQFSYAQDSVESAKIQYLIKSVECLQGVKFIRNGSEYDSAKAAEHMRYKLGKAGDRVKTAEDFIGLCSRSYLTGKPYIMRFRDGKTITVETFFRQRLKQYR